jgi:SAM-dependent methyltransferase
VSFAVPPDAYDRFMGRYSTQLSAPFADFAGVAPGQRVLDVGCGPGALTTELVARLGADAVAAVDPSPTFVVAARERHPGVDVRQASAAELPFGDGEFDASLAQLVVHFMQDPVPELREIARVTRPEGTVAACVWDHAGERSPLTVFWRAAHDVSEEGTTDESSLPGAREGHLEELFAAAGLARIEASELTARSEYATFDEYWATYELGAGPAGAFVAKLDDERRTALRERCRELLGAGPFGIDAVAWSVRGVPGG